jgi:hypothetical protein
MTAHHHKYRGTSDFNVSTLGNFYVPRMHELKYDYELARRYIRRQTNDHFALFHHSVRRLM